MAKKNITANTAAAGEKSPPTLTMLEDGSSYGVWVCETVDTSCSEARYVAWANVYSTRDKAMDAMKRQIEEDIEAGAILRDNLVERNGGMEVSDNDGRMYYKVSPRGIDITR